MTSDRFYNGSFIGTGADLSIEKVGFEPKTVFLINETDPGLAWHHEGMADDSMIKHVDGATTRVSSDGITITSTGFDLGADSDMNVDGQVVYFECRG